MIVTLPVYGRLAVLERLEVEAGECWDPGGGGAATV